jgi:YVTN family beta-propeller protein
VIYGATNTIETVTAGTNPYAVAVNPNTNKIYVANYGSNNVTVIDGATNSTTEVSAGTNPFTVAVNPNTNKIYVANYGSDNVTVIDGATNSTTTVTAGTFPYAAAVNPNTNKIYVANYGSNNVTVIDGATNSTTEVSAGTNPYAAAVNPNTNKIYVANKSSANVTVITEASIETSPLTTSVNAFANDTTLSTKPSFSGVATTTRPNTVIKMVGFQVDTTQGSWKMASLSSPGSTTSNWSGAAPSTLTYGLHTVYAVPLDDTCATAAQRSDPSYAGNIQAYQFLVQKNTLPSSYNTKVGAGGSWEWRQVDPEETVRSGTRGSWLRQQWDPGSPRKVPQGTPHDWNWESE